MNGRLILSLAAVTVMSVAAGAIYKWVDEQGVTHYSQSAPAGSAKEMDVAPPPDDARRREAEGRLDSMLREQRARDAERDARHERTTRRETAEQRLLLGMQINCRSARKAIGLFSRQRPIYRLNNACERVYVSDADRAAILGILNKLAPRMCTGSREAATDDESGRLLDAIRNFNDRHMATPGEPLSYPDFGSGDLLSSPDFCRCAPAFLREMAKPVYRTPGSEIEKARRLVGSRCP